MIKKQYAGWENIQTIQSKEILSELLDAKEFQRAKLLISDTGLGKTNSIEMFKRAKPVHTYVITVGDSFKLVHIVDAILKMLGVEGPKNEWRAGMAKMMINEKLELISEKLATIGNKNGKPVIILDEAENVKPSALKMVKELYDGIHKNCSIVLIGTDQILDSILNRKSKNRQSVPQLWRRFKAGTRYITTLNKARETSNHFLISTSRAICHCTTC